jgi:hypothetical protein
LKVYAFRSRREGLRRLVVGGLHGREGVVTGRVLERFVGDGRPRSGTLIVVPSLCVGAKYVSTLSGRYFETKEGKALLGLLKYYRPDVYVEVHCYSKKAYRALTSPARLERRGVPRLVELEKGVLIGSSPPHLLSTNFFKLGITVEVPCGGREGDDVLLTLLRVVRDQDTIEGILSQLEAMYPRQLREAIELYERYLDYLKSKRGLAPP